MRQPLGDFTQTEVLSDLNRKLLVTKGIEIISQWQNYIYVKPTIFEKDKAYTGLIKQLSSQVREYYRLSEDTPLRGQHLRDLVAAIQSDPENDKLLDINKTLILAAKISQIAHVYVGSRDYLGAPFPPDKKVELEEFFVEYPQKQQAAAQFGLRLCTLFTLKEQTDYQKALSLPGKSIKFGFDQGLIQFLMELDEDKLNYIYESLSIIQDHGQAFTKFLHSEFEKSDQFILRQPEALRLLKMLFKEGVQNTIQESIAEVKALKDKVQNKQLEAVEAHLEDFNFELKADKWILQPLQKIYEKEHDYLVEMRTIAITLNGMDPYQTQQVSDFISGVKKYCPVFYKFILDTDNSQSLRTLALMRAAKQDRHADLNRTPPRNPSKYRELFDTPTRNSETVRNVGKTEEQPPQAGRNKRSHPASEIYLFTSGSPRLLKMPRPEETDAQLAQHGLQPSKPPI